MNYLVKPRVAQQRTVINRGGVITIVQKGGVIPFTNTNHWSKQPATN